MSDLNWIKSSFSSDSANCVEVAWTTSSFCHQGSCVEVGWTSSSLCAGGDCLEATRTSDQYGVVLVRDSKEDPEYTLQNWPRDEWQFLLDAIELGIPYSGFRQVEDGNVRLGWAPARPPAADVHPGRVGGVRQGRPGGRVRLGPARRLRLVGTRIEQAFQSRVFIRP
jgi:hypothetical protein